MTKKKIYSYFRVILIHAAKMEYLTTNPLLKIGNFKETGEHERKKMNFYTGDEFQKFIFTAKEFAAEAEKRMM